MRNEPSMNNNTIIILNKYRLLLAILLITTIASISPLTSFAQEETRERGWNGRIIKAELLQILLNLKEDEFVAGYIINGSDIIEIIEESDIDIRIKNSVIEGGLDFTNLPVVDQRIEVNNKISIKNSEIGFWQAGNSKYSLYSGKTLFNKLISFRETQFSGEADFIKAQFLGVVSFYTAQFSGKSSFYNAQFSEAAGFNKAQFSGEAGFNQTQFNGLADFSQAQFNGVSFHLTTFGAETNFRYVRIYGALELEESNFEGNVDLRNSTIRKLLLKESSLVNSIDVPFDFRDATITEAYFEELQFTQKINFSDVVFGLNEDVDFVGPLQLDNQSPATVFRTVTFLSDANFTRAKFYGDVAFEIVNFEARANFTNAEFKPATNGNKPRLSLSFVTFEDPILDLGQFPNPGNWVKDEKITSFYDKERASNNRYITGKGLQPLSQVFQGLEATFNRKNKLSDKNKAFYHMKVEKLEEARADKSLYEQLTTGEVWGWVLWGWSSGWGTNIWRIVGVYTAGLFFFTFIFYGFSGRVKKKDTGEIKHDSEFRMRLINFPWYFMKSVEIKNKDVNEFFVAMRLSIVLLLKVGRRDTEVEGKLMKSIVWIEWVFGYYLLAVLVITLKNTVPIINSLISGVF